MPWDYITDSNGIPMHSPQAGVFTNDSDEERRIRLYGFSPRIVDIKAIQQGEIDTILEAVEGIDGEGNWVRAELNVPDAWDSGTFQPMANLKVKQMAKWAKAKLDES